MEVVMELADRLDPDHVTEWLDDPQIGVRALDNAPGVAEQRSCKRERSRRLPDTGWTVE